MYCPEHLAFKIHRKTWNFYVWMYWHDVPKHTIPLRIWLNPLRYELSLGFPPKQKFYRINREGQWNAALINFIYRFKRRRSL